MTSARTDWIVYAGLIGFGLFGPLLFPAYTNQIAVMWLLVLMAVTWDVLGGQPGYNYLRNIAFFGVGMYVSAVVQHAVLYDDAESTAALRALRVALPATKYFCGLAGGRSCG